MIEYLLRAFAGGATEAVKLTTEAALVKVEATMMEMRMEFRQMLSEGLYSTQMMLLETILIGFLFVIGFFYMGGGLTKIIDIYTGMPGTGSTVLGILFLIFGYVLLSKSRERIRAIKEAE
jgi:hypothetical protein